MSPLGNMVCSSWTPSSAGSLKPPSERAPIAIASALARLPDAALKVVARDNTGALKLVARGDKRDAEAA